MLDLDSGVDLIPDLRESVIPHDPLLWLMWGGTILFLLTLLITPFLSDPPARTIMFVGTTLAVTMALVSGVAMVVQLVIERTGGES